MGVSSIAPEKIGKVEGSVPLLSVKDPPTIQPLVPGFTTHQLPISLPNINFLRYREDGRLFAGGYNGKIYVLSDTNEDGLEDKSEVYYESEDLKVVMGMALTPPGYARGEGVFIATRGRILLILDEDRDGKGDKVITVADGWEETRHAAGGVSDALGVAIDKDGSVYFGLGTSDFTNAYLLDSATDKTAYKIGTERGTIQRVSPDFSKREAICTGIRFTFGLAFNSAGDLFATEQEGATWMVNGNPFDELLHIQTGRHYGFPPKHPQHLPDVIDEPSTFDYGPQHQSAVGLAFNAPIKEGSPSFGPAWWRGDAFVAAMSRGKIYRTKLYKTAEGYVAKNDTFAQLQHIVIDQVVSPSGALAVAIHSGAPDWGTGPTGAGEIWQIRSQKQLPPQPVIAWSSSPKELRVTFDSPLSMDFLEKIQGRVRVAQSAYAQAGERFETMRPGYKVVIDQLAAPRFQVAVQKLGLADGNRTLIITTPERSAYASYAISIECDGFQSATEGPYAGQIDVQSDLNGLDVEWKSVDGGSIESKWVPHPDLEVTRAFTKDGGAHREFLQTIEKRGTLTMRGQLDLGLMLYPAIQEGSKLDWDYPAEKVSVVFSAARPFKFTLGNGPIEAKRVADRFEVSKEITVTSKSWLPFALAFETGSGALDIHAHWSTDRSPTPRPFPLRRFLVPYAKQQKLAPITNREDMPELIGANWENGQTVYKASCAICHTIRGEGGKAGPDLTNLIYRDYDSVLRDIREPNAAINPEHISHIVSTNSGLTITGLVVAENPDFVVLAQANGKTVEVQRSDIDQMAQSRISLMPQGYDKNLTAEQTRDLMGYLLLPPFSPAPIMIDNPPPPRRMAEVKSILGEALTAKPDPNAKLLKIVLCASEKDPYHQTPGLHDYPLWRTRWSKLLGYADNLKIETANDWPVPDQWNTADIIVFNTWNPAWYLERDTAKIAALGKDMDSFLARGGGIVFIHYSLNSGPNAAQLASRLGLAWTDGSRFRPFATNWVVDPNHPLGHGFHEWQIPDESYWKMAGDLKSTNATVIATSIEENEPRPQIWTREVGPGRVFVCVPGHFTWTYDDPLFRILAFRGMMWTARQPIDRLAPLVIKGARVAP